MPGGGRVTARGVGGELEAEPAAAAGAAAGAAGGVSSSSS
jgi:hypothetical protein